MQFSFGIASGDTGLAMPLVAHQASANRPQKVQKNKRAAESRKRFHPSRTLAVKTNLGIASTSSLQEISETTPKVTNEPIDGPVEAVCGHYRIKCTQSLEKYRHLVEKIRKGTQKSNLLRKEEAAEKPRTTTPAIELHPTVRPMTWSRKFFESAKQFKAELTSRKSSWESDPQFRPSYGPDHIRTEMARARRKSKVEAKKKAATSAAGTAEKEESTKERVDNRNTGKNNLEISAGPSSAGNIQGLAGSSSEDEASSSSDIEDSKSVDETSESEEESTEDDEEIESLVELSDKEILGECALGYHTAPNPFYFNELKVGCQSPYCDSGSEAEPDANPELLMGDYRDSENNYGDEYTHPTGFSTTQEQSSALPLSAKNPGNYKLSSVKVPIPSDATPRTTFEDSEKGFSSFFKDLTSAAKCFNWSRNHKSGEGFDISKKSKKRTSSFLELEDGTCVENYSETSRSAPITGFKMVLRPQSKHAHNSYGDYNMKAKNSLFGGTCPKKEGPSLSILLKLNTLHQCVRFSSEFEEHYEILVVHDARKLLHANEAFSTLQIELANFNSVDEETCKDFSSKVAFPAKPATISQPSFYPMKTRYARQPKNSILRKKKKDYLPTFSISEGHYGNTENISSLKEELAALSSDLKKEMVLLAAVPHAQRSIRVTFQQCLLLTIKSSECARTRISQYISKLLEVKRELFSVFDRLAGACHEYGLFLEELASTPSSNRTLNCTERRLSNFLKLIKKAKRLLKGVSNGTKILKWDLSLHVPILVKLVQTVISSRNTCKLFSEGIGMEMELCPGIKAQYREMVRVSTFLEHHAALWDIDTSENALNCLKSGIEAVTDVKNDLEINIVEIIGKISDLQTPPVGARYTSDSESVEVLQPPERDHGMGFSNTTAHSFDLPLMSPSIQSSSILSSSPL